jgi:hypothetical protein
MAIFQLYPALQLRKRMKSLSQGSWLVLNTSHHVDLAAWLGAASTGLLSTGVRSISSGQFIRIALG